MIDDNLSRYLYNRPGNSFSYLEKIPQQVKPIVTQSDAKRGYIDRYFAKQINDNAFIVEIDRTQYEEFSRHPKFITARLKWRIVGKKENILFNGLTVPGVEEYNRMQVTEIDLTFDGLRKYIATYLEYWVAEEV